MAPTRSYEAMEAEVAKGAKSETSRSECRVMSRPNHHTKGKRSLTLPKVVEVR